MRLLYFDCFSGASGDMVLGALIDAGVPLAEVRRALGTLAVDPDLVWTERVTRAGVGATRFRVQGEEPPDVHAHDGAGHHHHQDLDPDHGHGHGHDRDHRVGQEPHGHGGSHSAGAHHHDRPHTPSHEHGHAAGDPHVQRHDHGTAVAAHHHPHRSLAEIGQLIDASALSPAGRQRARDLFLRLGEAEAAIHGTTLDRVHLHEVGALDSVIDIVRTVFAMEYLGVEQVVASPLNVGKGSITSAHGYYPVPAPATIRLLRDVPIFTGPQTGELVTPTGALLVTGYAASFGAIPPMRVEAIGYGAGARETPGAPNVLRVLLGEAESTGQAWPRGHRVVVLESEIDDMNPQLFGPLMDRLLADGALDVYYTAVQMKKNRPGTLLTVVAPPEARERLLGTIFRETTTIGVRHREMARECLDRETVTVETPAGPVRMKVARRDGHVLNVSPEFDDCVRAAAESGWPVKTVQAAALRAFADRQASP